ncbi:MAG TPA: hypothetical protein VKI00_15960 [Mycobacterium sp.]|nr:hypothetical protein [Mycobacterium sp.]HME77078.1 hypothetical protein [Mycobacterium sp.]
MERVVAEGLQETVAEHPRPLYVVYLNSLHRKVSDAVLGGRTVHSSHL